MINPLEQFINDIYSNKTLINYLFENRKVTLSRDRIEELPFVNEDKIDYLIDKSIINQNAYNISIDINLIEFFENFLNISEEINTSYINDIVKELENNIDFYIEETREKERDTYISKIKRYLKGIARNINKDIINLRRNIDNVYKTEQNFNIKKKKLEDYKQKREDIVQLKMKVENLLDNKRFLLEGIGDLELNSIIIDVYNNLDYSITYLITIQQELIEYINKSEIYGDIFKKIQKLKQLKDQHEIKSKTNLHKIIKNENSLVLQPKKTFFYKISEDFLRQDEGFQIIKRTSIKYTNRKKIPLASNQKISEYYFNDNQEIEKVLDLEIIKKHFDKSDKDLFKFLLELDITKDLEIEEKLSIFCRIISEFEKELIIKEELKSYDKFDYALVYSGEKFNGTK